MITDSLDGAPDAAFHHAITRYAGLSIMQKLPELPGRARASCCFDRRGALPARGTMCEHRIVVANESSLDWLHDARLIAIEVSWPSQTARVTIEVDTVAARAGSLSIAGGQTPAESTAADLVGVAVFECRGIRRVVVPRQEPWGPSVYVNTVKLATDGNELRIEMGSGDFIEIDAGVIVLDHEALQAPP